MNLFYFRETIEYKLFKKKRCPVDHQNRDRLQKQGTSHRELDKPFDNQANFSQSKPVSS